MCSKVETARASLSSPRQVRRAKQGLDQRDERPPGAGEVTFHIFLDRNCAVSTSHSGMTRNHQNRHPVGEVRLHEELAAWLDDPAQLLRSALAIDYVVPDEEQQGGVTRGIWQRDVLGRPSRIPDGGMASAGKGLSTHLV